MKKVLTFATAATMLAFIACGPSEADKEKAAQHVKDSIHMADSTMKAAAWKQHVMDSTTKAMNAAKDTTKKGGDTAKAATK